MATMSINIARKWLTKHVSERYAVNENRRPLLGNGIGYHGSAVVSGQRRQKTQWWNSWGWCFASRSPIFYKGSRDPELKRTERPVRDLDSSERFLKQTSLRRNSIYELL
jgi:hypothetical protein